MESRNSSFSLARTLCKRATKLSLITFTRTQGITGWRRGPKLPGKPDFVFPKLKLAVFVDGCFWHGCPKHGTSPKANASFWLAKITGNQARDRRVNRLLRAKGWKVLRIWDGARQRGDGRAGRHGPEAIAQG